MQVHDSSTPCYAAIIENFFRDRIMFVGSNTTFVISRDSAVNVTVRWRWQFGVKSPCQLWVVMPLTGQMMVNVTQLQQTLYPLGCLTKDK